MTKAQCPFGGDAHVGASSQGTTNKDWWPNQLDLKLLDQQSNKVNPLDPDFDYRKEFESLDYYALKEDLFKLMTDSQDWWPADYGHYGPLFIRMAWHSAGTYRVGDGRGGGGTGNQRFAPINSWPDNANLDKARRLLWPIKKKYGQKISWADLLILAGNCALESMGFKTLGFGGGREDIWEPEEIYWGKETEWLGDERYSGDRKLENPLAAVQMGLIYVNPEGPNGMPDAVASARDIRDTFGRMGMNDEETVALIAGGHTFGKCHGAVDPSHLGPDPEGAPVQEMGLGWTNSQGNGDNTLTSGIEGPWNSTPTKWDMGYLSNLFGNDWNLVKSPAGAFQWVPADSSRGNAPKAHNEQETQPTIMTTADMGLRMDPAYKKIAEDFLAHPEKFEAAFARAWFKLTHRDMGPKARYLGPEVPQDDFLWQDPVPASQGEALESSDVKEIKRLVLESELTIPEMVKTAWKAAFSFRASDKRGGVNGARLFLEPQRSWIANEPQELERVEVVLRKIQAQFNETHADKHLSLADLIVIAGAAGLEAAAANSGADLEVPVRTGRTDADQENTDVRSFSVLEPKADAFINYLKENLAVQSDVLLLDKAELLGLTAPELTVLMGGMRALKANYGASKLGIFTDDDTSKFDNEFFVNLLDMSTKWLPMDGHNEYFRGVDRMTGEQKWTASRTDLIFGSNSQLRALAEVYASDDAHDKFLRDFVRAWNKLMEADLFA